MDKNNCSKLATYCPQLACARKKHEMPTTQFSQYRCGIGAAICSVECSHVACLDCPWTCLAA
eukprot:1414074-Amphidinium_carterae.1